MKNGLLWGILAVVIVGGGIWWWAMKAPAKQPATTDSNTQTSTTSGSQQTSIKALMAAGSPVSCTFASTASTSTETGTVYVANNKMRGDFTAAGTTGHMINDGTSVYIWSDAMAQGFKMAADAMSNTSSNATVSQAPDINANQSLDCNPWTADTASFTPPSTIKFSAMPTVPAVNTNASSSLGY